MRQFDVFVNPASKQVAGVPFVAVLSSHLVDLSGVLVAPLQDLRRIVTPAVEISVLIQSQSLVLSLLGMAAVSPSQLKRPIGSLIDYEDAIRRGLDRLFTGF